MNLEKINIVGEELSDESQLAVHIFKFHELTISWNDERLFLTDWCRLTFKIFTRCVNHGNLFYTINISTEARGLNSIECIKKGIQRVFEHEADFDWHFHSAKCNCLPKYFKMVYDFSDVTDKDFREMFEQVFNTSNWTIQRQIT